MRYNLGMPNYRTFANETALDLGSFVNRAQQGLRPSAVPEPDAGESVLGGPGWFHFRLVSLYSVESIRLCTLSMSFCSSLSEATPARVLRT